MRFPILILGLGLVACGNDSTPPGPDGPTGNRPDPRVIPGGGIGDGPIDGVVNLYVIDDATRDPIDGAEVRVGNLAGTTDADGLFIADGLVGPQTIAVKASGNRRQELWVGANGANITLNLEPANEPTPASADLAGTIPNFITAALPPNVFRLATVSYSQTDDLGDPANELTQAVVNNIPQNMCAGLQPADPCAFTVTSRTGKVTLIATINDIDTKGTPEDTDDTSTLVGYAIRQAITVTANQNQSNQTLTAISAGNLQDVTVDFESPPSNLSQRFAIVMMEIGDDGVLPIQFVNSAARTIRAPTLAALGATGYRLIAIATDGATTDAKQSVVLRRALSGPTLAAGEWLAPPTGITVSRTRGELTNSTGAQVHSFEVTQGSTAVVNVSIMDTATTEFEFSDLITLPSAQLTVAVNAIGADGLDVTNFSLDADRNKLNRIAGQGKTLP